jgi:hypothetical protein
MPPANPKPKATPAPSAIHRLSQQDAAKLIGKPAVWLRDNPHVVPRNADGRTYDGAAVVQAMLAQVPTPDLPDAELEPLLQAAEEAATFCGDRLYLGIELLEGLQRRYGAPGLAVFGELVLAYLRAWQLTKPTAPQPVPSVAEIEAKELADARRRIDQQLAEISVADWQAREAGRVVQQCYQCKRYRWGRSWRPLPAPVDYAVDHDVAICPKCLE